MVVQESTKTKTFHTKKQLHEEIKYKSLVVLKLVIFSMASKISHHLSYFLSLKFKGIMGYKYCFFLG